MWYNKTVGALPMLSSFDAVKARYENTKPIISKRLTEADDVRPLGLRSAQHFTIRKVNDNCYALLAGCEPLPHVWALHTQDNGKKPADYDAVHKALKEELENFATVVWRKHRGGGEILTIRRPHYGQSNATYMLLTYCVPVNYNYNRNGEHWITVRGQDYALRKNDRVSNWFADRYNRRVNTIHKIGGKGSRYIKLYRASPSSEWEVKHHMGDRKSARKAKTLHVDKAAKRPYERHLREFKLWARTMIPLMGLHTQHDLGAQAAAFVNGIDERVKAAHALPSNRYYYRPGSYGWLRVFDTGTEQGVYARAALTELRDALKTPERHMGLLVWFLSQDADASDWWLYSEEDFKSTKAERQARRLNLWLNHIMGFNKQKET